MLNHKDVDCVSIRGASQKLRLILIVEHKRVDVRIGRAAAYLLISNCGSACNVGLSCFENPYNCAGLTSCCEEITSLTQHDCFNRSVVGLKDIICVIWTVVGDTNVAFLTTGCRKNRRVLSVRVEGTQSLRVIASINSIDQPQVSKVVHIDSLFEDDHNSIRIN